MKRLTTIGICCLLGARAGWAQDSVSTGTNTGVSANTAVTSISLPAAMTTAQISARKANYTVTVPGTGAWVDAGFSVVAGDTLSYGATGKLLLADGRETAAAGISRGWKDLLRQFPLDSANAGALIGRIGTSDAVVPFAVGGQLEQTVPANGELFLAANLPQGLAGQGSYAVTVRVTAATAASVATTTTASRLLTPSLLSGVPQRVEDEQGNPGDMVNFCIVGAQDAVEKAFTAAGWVQVDKSTDAAVVHGLIATLSHKSYLEMPMSTLYLFGRPQDLSYARGDAIAVAMVRHHLRVWNTGRTVDGLPVWVGSSTHDNGLERDDRNNGITHHIDPNVDEERDFIESSFASAGALAAAAYIMPSDPLKEARTATGGSFHSDGRVLAMVLRR